jgi:hypothetical protein
VTIDDESVAHFCYNLEPATGLDFDLYVANLGKSAPLIRMATSIAWPIASSSYFSFASADNDSSNSNSSSDNDNSSSNSDNDRSTNSGNNPDGRTSRGFHATSAFQLLTYQVINGSLDFSYSRTRPSDFTLVFKETVFGIDASIAGSVDARSSNDW